MSENKIAIVTGGTGALGSAVTEKFAQSGMKVYIPARNIERFKDIFDSSKSSEPAEFKLRKIYGLLCNNENESEVIEFIGNVIIQEGRVDFLVNTAGGYHPKNNILDMDSSLVDKMMSLNFKTAFYFSKNVLKSMIEQNYGRIISVAAMPALEVTAGKFAYSVSKSAVVNLMQTIAEECKGYNITANTIVPSIIDTEANRKSMPNAEFEKWVKAEEIAETMMFLLSDSARSFRGNVVKMCGKI
jgi:NAD(P)-dependent dehydrogenase (short-subunit alcohol dehydrogenase family)